MTDAFPGIHIDRASAICYGMPNIGCHYTRDDVTATAPDDTWVACAACGRTATQCHHEPPRSKSGAIDPETGRKKNGALLLKTAMGQFVLKPSLIALCAECHARRHAGGMSIAWRFDDEEDEDRWVCGDLLAHGIRPHDPILYLYGRWVFKDERTGEEWERREGGI